MFFRLGTLKYTFFLVPFSISLRICCLWICLVTYEPAGYVCRYSKSPHMLFFTLFQVVPLCHSLNASLLTCLGSSCPKTLQSRIRKGKALRYLCETSMHQILQNFVFCITKRVPSEFLGRKLLWYSETVFAVFTKLESPQHFCLLRHTSAMYRKEGFFLDFNSQMFCGKFHSCDQKLDDLVSRTATK